MKCLTQCIIISAVLTLSAIVVTGQNPNLSTVSFELYTRNNPTAAFSLHVNLDNIGSSYFNATLRTLFIIHGWQDCGTTSWVLTVKTNYLTVLDCNVIVIDWGEIAGNIDYNQAVSDMYPVANLVAGFIDNLVVNTALTTSMIHVTGHSLGGQMAGMIGKYVNANYSIGTLDRVTGLDPAGPNFENVPSNMRIYNTDADFVDIIHTNTACFGLDIGVGDVDFYPNGGELQAGCSSDDLYCLGDCSHEQAHDLWAESILAGHVSGYPNEFVAWPCSSYTNYLNGGCTSCGQGCLNMGFYVIRTLTGNYYLNTNSAALFANGNVQ